MPQLIFAANKLTIILSTTYGRKFYHNDAHNTNGKFTWPCNVNRLDIETDGTEAGTHLTPVSQGEMPYPPCMLPDYWTGVPHEGL